MQDTPRKRKVLKISFWALFIGVIFSFGLAIFLFLQSTQTTTASPDPGWLSGYGYRKQITINGTTAGAQTNYQMLLTVNKGAGDSSGNVIYLKNHALSWGSTVPNDLRFTKADGTTLLNYWIESSDANTAKVWIKFDSIGTTDTDFYVYYGKSGDTTTSDEVATALNGYAEDYEPTNNFADTLDSPWEVSIEQALSQSHSAKCPARNSPGSDVYVRRTTAITFPTDTVLIKTAAWLNETIADDYFHLFVFTNSADDAWVGPAVTIYGGKLMYRTLISWQDSGWTMPLAQWVYFQMRLKPGTNNFDVYTSSDGSSWTIRITDGTYIGAISGGTACIVKIACSYSANGSTSLRYQDNYFWRKYIDPEPTWGTWGSEETPPAGAGRSFGYIIG